MKKFLKITIGILLLLLVVFLLTGLLVKETNYEVSTTVNKPLNEVFAAFNNSKELQKWIPAVKSIEPVEEKTGMVGSTYKMIVIDANGNDFEMIETITAFEVNKRIGLAFDAQGMLKTDDITFLADGNSTVITNKASCKGTSFLLKCTFPFLKSMFKKSDQESLNGFKKYIEQLN
tara:strand:- start:475967 stop:476491 length:525 start_codon:yes stop_codon:yes gene_type:complete